jgi:DNA repair ATPase RecN
MPFNLARAKEIDSFMQTDHQMQAAFERLRLNEEYFRAAGEPVYSLWKNVVAFGQDFHTIVTTMIERKNWQAQWALDHGLNRLTEIRDEQLYEVESRLREFDISLQKYLEKIDSVGADAEKLRDAYLKMNDPVQDGRALRLKHRSTIMELFQSLSVFREASVAWRKPAIDFLVLEEEWGWWRARKAIAEKLEKESPA